MAARHSHLRLEPLRPHRSLVVNAGRACNTRLSPLNAGSQIRSGALTHLTRQAGQQGAAAGVVAIPQEMAEEAPSTSFFGTLHEWGKQAVSATHAAFQRWARARGSGPLGRPRLVPPTPRRALGLYLRLTA
jgi:hypothetical protein